MFKKLLIAGAIMASTAAISAPSSDMKITIQAGGQTVEAFEVKKIFEAHSVSKSSFVSDVIKNSKGETQEVPGAFSKELLVRANLKDNSGKTARIEISLAHDFVKKVKTRIDGIEMMKPSYTKCEFNKEISVVLDKSQRLGDKDCEFTITVSKAI